MGQTKSCDELTALANENAFPAAEAVDDLQICNEEWRRKREA